LFTLKIQISLGIGTYNGVWTHLYHRYIKRDEGANETASLVPDYEEGNFRTEKDSVNR